MQAVTSPSDLARRERETIVRTARVAGASTVWRVWEPEAAAEPATTVVLVHGFRGTHLGLWPVAAALPEVRFIAPDLPGFGESAPLPIEHDLDAYAQWLEAFLAEADPAAEAVVLGHSFGSLIVARRPAGLGPRRVVLVNPIAAPALEGPSRIMTQLAIGYYRIGAALPEPLGRALLAHPLITRVMSEVMATTRDGALRRWIHAQHAAWFSTFHDRGTLLEAFRASVSDSVLAHAEELPDGTVLVAGERDAIAPLAAPRILRSELGVAGPGLGDGADRTAR